jgi:lysozyme family protein
MQDSFEKALACVLRHEGGWSDHVLDPGGATNRGITRATLERVRGRPVSKAELMALSPAETATIYRRLYWNAVAGDALPAGVDLAVFDCAVNSGPRRAALLLQQALGVTADGIVGPRTLAAAGAADARSLIRQLQASRLAFLRRLPTFAVFGRGWSRRVAEVERAALTLAGTPATATPHPPAARPTQQETDMLGLKSILASRTVLANLVGLVAFGLSAAGFDTGSLKADALVDAALATVTGASFVASTVFRVVATKKLVA